MRRRRSTAQEGVTPPCVTGCNSISEEAVVYRLAVGRFIIRLYLHRNLKRPWKENLWSKAAEEFPHGGWSASCAVGLPTGKIEMRIAAIYDIHANLPALEAVLEDIRHSGADAVVVGGDVLPGPMPRESLARLLSLRTPLHCIQGNGEVGCSTRWQVRNRWAIRSASAHHSMDGTAASARSRAVSSCVAKNTSPRDSRAGSGSVLPCHTPKRQRNIHSSNAGRTPRTNLRGTGCVYGCLWSHPYAVRSNDWADASSQCRKRRNAVRRRGRRLAFTRARRPVPAHPI